MLQDWNDVTVAKEWDSEGNQTNPTRSEQLDILVHVLAQFYQEGDWILDLGYGSGKVEELIFKRIPHARVVGVDGSDEMMKLAADRLKDYEHAFIPVKYNLAKLASLQLPQNSYHFVIAIQSLHHLSEEEMQVAYHRIYDVLEPGGLFLLLDRLKIETASLWDVIHQIWRRQDTVYGSTVAVHEGANFRDHAQSVMDRGDYPVRLDDHLSWMRQCGFDAACLHLHANRALVVGRKPK